MVFVIEQFSPTKGWTHVRHSNGMPKMYSTRLAAKAEVAQLTLKFRGEHFRVTPVKD